MATCAVQLYFETTHFTLLLSAQILYFSDELFLYAFHLYRAHFSDDILRHLSSKYLHEHPFCGHRHRVISVSIILHLSCFGYKLTRRTCVTSIAITELNSCHVSHNSSNLIVYSSHRCLVRNPVGWTAWQHAIVCSSTSTRQLFKYQFRIITSGWTSSRNVKW